MRHRIASIFAACAMAGASLGLFLTPASAPRAADTAERPVTIVVPFPPGGPTDASARAVAQEMGRKSGMSFVIENVPGAGGTIGATKVAEAAPDGHTFLWGGTSTLVMAPQVYPHLRYTPASFMPIAFAVSAPMVLAVHPSVKAATIEELVKLGRSRPDALNYGSAGKGSASHLVAEMFKRDTGVLAVHVAYKGGAAAVADLLGGQIDYVFDTPSLIAPMAVAGKVRPLAVTGAARHRLLPAVPTLGETVAPGFETESWFGLVGPRDTPAPLARKLNAMVNDALATPSVASSLEAMGFDVRPMTQAEYAARIQIDSRKWQALVRATHIVLQ